MPSAVDTVDGINLLEPQTSEAMLAKQSLKVNRVTLMSLKGKKRRDSFTSSIDRKNRKNRLYLQPWMRTQKVRPCHQCPRQIKMRWAVRTLSKYRVILPRNFHHSWLDELSVDSVHLLCEANGITSKCHICQQQARKRDQRYFYETQTCYRSTLYSITCAW